MKNRTILKESPRGTGVVVLFFNRSCVYIIKSLISNGMNRCQELNRDVVCAIQYTLGVQMSITSGEEKKEEKKKANYNSLHRGRKLKQCQFYRQVADGQW